jgi:hypothetical protein
MIAPRGRLITVGSRTFPPTVRLPTFAVALTALTALTRAFHWLDRPADLRSWMHADSAGFGDVADSGRAGTASRAALGLNSEHGVRAVSKQTLFLESDVITVHMALADSTRGLVGPSDLALMKASAYLVNTSRGPLIDEAALIDALHNRRIAGAGLDVFDVEPLAANSPFRSLSNTLLLPHLGYVTTDGYRNFYSQIVEDIIAWSEGNPIRTL